MGSRNGRGKLVRFGWKVDIRTCSTTNFQFASACCRERYA